MRTLERSMGVDDVGLIIHWKKVVDGEGHTLSLCSNIDPSTVGETLQKVIDQLAGAEEGLSTGGTFTIEHYDP